jgi:transketolase
MRQEALETVHKMAKKDERIVFVGSDLGAGTLLQMQKELPNQFFMEGISEQHIIGFCAGLAELGFVPYVNTIANFFARRAYEQIAVDLCLHNYPVRILASGGGMVYAPLGPTHTAIEDLALMLSIPGLKVFAPADSSEMRNILHASANDPSPWYIRFGKGGEPIVTRENDDPFVPKIFGGPECEVLLITTGITLHNALAASEKLALEGISCSTVHISFLNDLVLESWLHLYDSAISSIVLEEHIPKGGLFTQILHEFHTRGLSAQKLSQVSLPFEFPQKYGTQQEHLEYHGFGKDSVADRVNRLLGRKG